MIDRRECAKNDPSSIWSHSGDPVLDERFLKVINSTDLKFILACE